MDLRPPMPALLAEYNIGVLLAKQAYNDDPNSTHRQRDDYTKEHQREHEADARRRG